MTGLPANNTAWPIGRNLDRLSLCDAWYAGAPDRLTAAHGGATVITTGGPSTTLNPGGNKHTRVVGSTSNRFWATRSEQEIDTRRHLPVPEDIARSSARLLFSEQLQIRVDGPTQDNDGPVGQDGEPQWYKGDPTPETLAAQRRLDAILSKCNFGALLLAAAEVGSALGSVGLRIVFDKLGPIKDRPIIARVDADAIIPEYAWGQLVGVTFWRQVMIDKDGVVWRHFEYYPAGTGRVYHGLYKGTGDNVGERQDLSAHPSTRGLITDDEGGITISTLPVATRIATSIPNMLPDPLDRKNNAGRSDYTPAVMELFDSIDALYTQMMDEIEDARGRLLVAESMLERKAPGQGQTFDREQRVFKRVKVPPAEKEGGGLPIEMIQFEMRVEAYLRTIDALTSKAVEAAGYNSGTDKGEDGRDITATEIRADAALSMGTRDTKIRYWQPELEALLTTLLAVDVEQFASRDPETNEPIKAHPVTVTFPDSVQPTTFDLAGTAKALKEADASSRYERVRTVHPEWTDRQINAELERIKAESEVLDPVTFGEAGAGVGVGDGI